MRLFRSQHSSSIYAGFLLGLLAAALVFTGAWKSITLAASSNELSDRLQGNILLQVESHGEAWYVKPGEKKRYYLRDGAAAYAIMRYHSLGISNADLEKLLDGNADLLQRVKGKIVLQVEAHGEAYYVCPRDMTVTYIKDGGVAYQVMRSCGLGITNADLKLIPVAPESALTPDGEGGEEAQPSPVSGGGTTLAGCPIFPADNPWNQDVSKLPVHPNSATYINSIGASRGLHPDFGSNPEYGIPYNVVEENQPLVPITFTAYGDESDPGPYPVPANAKREAGSDRHVIVLQKGKCKLYELFAAERNTADGGWFADSGAVFNLLSNDLRPEGWTSADAAGLAIFPGLIRYEEVTAGKITHAIRFTASKTQRGYIHPAVHFAGSNDASLPPMGLRVRMKSSYDISKLTGHARVIAEAMKTYGMMLADNGSSWYFQGATDSRWDDDDLNQLKKIPGSAFEAVYTGEIIK